MSSKGEFTPQTVVRNSAGRIGVVVPDLPWPLNCNLPEEVGVVYEGNTASLGTDWRTLEIIGSEKAVADRKGCGAGKGSKCCKFLVAGANGLECQRFGYMRFDLIFKDMVAQREPSELYPNCKLSS